MGENPSGLGGWGNRHSLTGSCAGGPVVFQRCEHRVSPGAPLSIPHLCPWVKARSSFPAGSDFMWGSLGPLDVAGGTVKPLVEEGKDTNGIYYSTAESGSWL